MAYKVKNVEMVKMGYFRATKIRFIFIHFDSDWVGLFVPLVQTQLENAPFNTLIDISTRLKKEN